MPHGSPAARTIRHARPPWGSSPRYASPSASPAMRQVHGSPPARPAPSIAGPADAGPQNRASARPFHSSADYASSCRSQAETGPGQWHNSAATAAYSGARFPVPTGPAGRSPCAPARQGGSSPWARARNRRPSSRSIRSRRSAPLPASARDFPLPSPVPYARPQPRRAWWDGLP